MKSRQTLSGKTFALFFALSFVVMVAATVAATAASYTTYEANAEQVLLTQARAYGESLEGCASAADMSKKLQQLPLVDTRCTLIDADGTVVYDNYADAATMENHGTREEVAAAREAGQDVVMRRSETLGSDTLYAAVLVKSGVVLRLAETRTSLPSFLGGMGLQLGISLVVILLLSLVAARIITGMVVRPLRQIDLSHPLENDAYAELQPLLARVDAQRRELESQNEELEQAVTLRRDFTGNVSHEMKTPLQVIGGYAELMQNGMIPPDDVPHFAGLIREESESMRVLIDDVLTLSRLDEAGSGSAELVDVSEVCSRVADRLESKALERGCAIDLSCQGQCLVMGSPGSVEHMVYNLVDNAIAYNEEGESVDVTVQKAGDLLELHVLDRGPGVPDEHKTRVFERFYRVDASRSRATGGTGLGLAIVKHAVESLGGTVEVRDRQGGGADFVVCVPAASMQA